MVKSSKAVQVGAKKRPSWSQNGQVGVKNGQVGIKHGPVEIKIGQVGLGNGKIGV